MPAQDMMAKMRAAGMQAPPGLQQALQGIDQRKADQISSLNSAEEVRQKDRNDAMAQQRQLADTSQQMNVRNQLAEQMQGVKAGANKRGLLYSGINQAAQGGLRAGAESQIAGGRANINAASQDQLAQLEGQDLSNSMQRQQNQIKMNQANFKMALDKKKQDQEMGRGIGGAIGSGIGSIASALTGGLL